MVSGCKRRFSHDWCLENSVSRALPVLLMKSSMCVRWDPSASEPLLSQWITAFVVRLKWHCAVWPQGRRRGRADQGPAATSPSERGGGRRGLGSCTVAPRYQQGPLLNGEAVRKLCRRWAVIYTFLPHSLHPPLPTAVLPTSYQRKQNTAQYTDYCFLTQWNRDVRSYQFLSDFKIWLKIFRCLIFMSVYIQALMSASSGLLSLLIWTRRSPQILAVWSISEPCVSSSVRSVCVSLGLRKRSEHALTSVTDQLQVIKAVCLPSAGEWKGRSVIKSHWPGLRSVTGRVNADRWDGVV